MVLMIVMNSNMAKFGHMAIYAKNMAEWGIPEKSIKNAAQKRRIQDRRALHSRVMAKNRFFGNFTMYISL